MPTDTKTYEYSVRDRKGKLVKGTLEAQNESALVQKLNEIANLRCLALAHGGASGLGRDPFDPASDVERLAHVLLDCARQVNECMPRLRGFNEHVRYAKIHKDGQFCHRAWIEGQKSTPFELGLDWTVNLDKPGYFVGRRALERAEDDGEPVLEQVEPIHDTGEKEVQRS